MIPLYVADFGLARVYNARLIACLLAHWRLVAMLAALLLKRGI